MSFIHVFAGSNLDRRGQVRRDDDWMSNARKSGRYVVVWQSQALVTAEGANDLRTLTADEASEHLEHEDAARSLVFLGVDPQDVPHFAFDVSHMSDEPPAVASSSEFADLRHVAPVLDPERSAMMAYARAMMRWHHQHRYCGACGNENRVEQAGHVRRCPNCKSEHFPRTDPAVIMLVHDGAQRCLLGRQASWPRGVFSTLAGFVEPGESLEEAVAREVYEETQVTVQGASYHSSQPWPFPGSIMLGFHAEARFSEPFVDGDELEQARWFERDELFELQARRELRFPPPMSIARQLLDAWLGVPGR